jgi:hypothetical protein
MYRKKNETPQWTHTANLSSTSHTLTDLSPNTEYEWQVIAVDKCGAKSTESSSPWTFTTAVTTYTVTFFIDGGKLSSSLLTQSVAKGGTIKYPGNPTKQGYDFGGWYYGYNTPWNFVYGTVNSDMTLWAKWLPAAAASLRSDYHNRTVLLDWNDLETKTITFVSSGLNWEVSAKSPGDWLIFAVDGSQHSTFNKYGEDNKPTVHTIYYRARTRNATAYAQNGEIVISDWKYNRLSPVKVKLVQQTQPQPAPPSVTINFAQHEAYYFQADGTPKNPKYSSFILSANVSWKISSDRCCNNSFVEIMENGGASWLKMSNGPYLDLSGTKTICLKVDKNTTGSDRTETLTVKDISSGTQATIRIEQSATSVDNEVIPDGEDALWYYPNPAGKTLTVRAPNPHGEKVTVSLNSLSGQSVYRAETYETEHRIDVQSLNRGVYILYVTVGNERYTAKVIRK